MNPSSEQIERILKALEGMQYGSVVITVHDSQIVQIDRTEKYRISLEKSSRTASRSGKGQQQQ
ncbi:YezD family protein [Polycladomyces subterraneus]|uniref:YezD family protein n=1 Tax=Polycladomyces subterraneus TaxID=1016997 RepID=A0ABT8IQQ6_9BACL|nr:YezD family protein [Polycladomyces subterraneus]MDN4595131.1 YezD family protein [Polycladomyces subterraneus]